MYTHKVTTTKNTVSAFWKLFNEPASFAKMICKSIRNKINKESYCVAQLFYSNFAFDILLVFLFFFFLFLWNCMVDCLLTLIVVRVVLAWPINFLYAFCTFCNICRVPRDLPGGMKSRADQSKSNNANSLNNNAYGARHPHRVIQHHVN